MSHNLLSVNALSKLGREQLLFTNVSFGLQEGEKAALIGRNGTGKSTLLATIAGVLQPDEGTVVTARDAGISFLPQNPQFNADDTIRTHILKNDSPKLRTITDYLELCGRLEKEHENSEIRRQYEKILQKMDDGDLWSYEAQISSVLSTLGITDLNQKMGGLSGGMVKKVALAQVLAEDTKLLLLDEPTNHLDITTISWLQNYLHDTKRAVLMVTHDRYFLDAVCTTIYELARGRLTLYEGNYSRYLEKKTLEAEIEANTERRIESVLRFERDWLLRGPCARGTKAKARIQRDEQLINREKFQTEKGFTFEVKGKRLGGKVLELHNVTKAFGDNTVISGFSYKFTKGQKIGIFGDNGSGKSTLLNLITGGLAPDSGTIETGQNTQFGYYAQNPAFADTSQTVLEYIKETAEHMHLNSGGKDVSASRFLEEFGFSGKIQHSPVGALSGGERKRLFLVRLLLENPNFLILDEPTNDFDIFTMNLLEQFLLTYEGCLLLVTHDRYFMDKTVDSLFILENGGISGFVGKCSEYIALREEMQKEKKKEGDAPCNDCGTGSVATPATGTSAASGQNKKLSFREQKEFESLDTEIPALEAEQKALEADLSSSDFVRIQAANTRYQEIARLLEQKYPRWEELAARV